MNSVHAARIVVRKVYLGLQNASIYLLGSQTESLSLGGTTFLYAKMKIPDNEIGEVDTNTE